MTIASNLLSYLWGRPKDSSGGQGDSVTTSVSAQRPPHVPPSTWSLPTELWIQILEYVPRHTLAHVMLVNRALSDAAERILYHTIVLKWNTPETRKFRDTIAACPRRGALVIDISILRIDGADARLNLPAVLPPLLNVLMALPNLRAVTLRSSMPIPVSCENASIFDIRLPHLRRFAASLKIDPVSSSAATAFLAFLAAHPALDTLDLRSSTLPDLHALRVEQHVAALRVLACSSRFLNSRAPVPGSLTHLHRTAYISSEVAHIAALLGPQLLSLRLGGRLAMPGALAGRAGAGELGWEMDEVKERFPRLRYLQVDSPYKERPYLDTSVVDWLRPRSATGAQAPSNPGTPAQKLKIVWTYVEGFWSDAEGWAATYDAFLDDAAVQCLKGWSGYVERVVYERSIRPYPMVSVRLKPESEGVEERVVRVQDADIGWGDYWKRA